MYFIALPFSSYNTLILLLLAFQQLQFPGYSTRGYIKMTLALHYNDAITVAQLHSPGTLLGAALQWHYHCSSYSSIAHSNEQRDWFNRLDSFIQQRNGAPRKQINSNSI